MILGGRIMLSKSMEKALSNRSAIREIFEYGVQLAKEIGADNVFDYSLGNPATPAPKKFDETIIKLETTVDPLELHGYTDNAGIPAVRDAIAMNLNERFNTEYTESDIIMTVGAGGALNTVLRTIIDPGDEVITFAPYFSEYDNYVANHHGKLTVIAPNFAEGFQPDTKSLRETISANTKAVLVNTPNNPSGVVYSEEAVKAIAKVLEDKSVEYGHVIYLISDEPYRELLYDGAKHYFLSNYYDNTFICYSFSKSLSLPGERIGYVAVSPKMEERVKTATAVKIANRILGFVNAPALMQLALKECLNEQSDITYYDNNRKILLEGLTEAGFTATKPEGAFYLFLKSPVADDVEFCEVAKKYNLMIVPGSSFGCPGYVRLSYCVDTDKIKRSMAKFQELGREYGLN